MPAAPAVDDHGRGAISRPEGLERPVVTATFIFHQIKRDPDFDRLDVAAAAAAESLPGYLDRKKWYDREGNMSVVYYWESLEALEEFARHPAHLEAKARYAEWYGGYRIEIASVLRAYGDGYYDGFPEPSGPQEA